MQRTLFSPKDFFGDVAVVETRQEKLRVAAYARVSTEKEMQESSLENQIMHYTSYIRTNPDYQFVGVYSDRGKTGTHTKSRLGFQKLIADALDGKIDLIFCKSISRFSRNVVDIIDIMRTLKEHNVRIIFEKEGLDSQDMQDEFVLTMFSVLAEEESKNLSENVNWSVKRKFEQGSGKYTRLLGYDKTEDERWVIVEDEAKIIKEAFKEFVDGKAPTQIARSFIKKGYQKKNGRIDWSAVAIRDILRNEKYIGDVLCQKTYTKDFLSHKSMINNGEKMQYYIEDHHEAIIDKDTYHKAQKLLDDMTTTGKARSKATYPLSSRMVCKECGGNFQRYTCRGVVRWRCGNRMKSKFLCTAEAITDEAILKVLITAFKERYKIKSGRYNHSQVTKMLKEMKTATSNREFEQNKLRLDLENALLTENTAIIHLDQKGQIAATAHREEIEQKLIKAESLWKLFDKDDKYRQDAINVLEKINQTEKNITENIQDIYFLRAWVLRLEILSPFLFTVTWLTGEESVVKLRKGAG